MKLITKNKQLQILFICLLFCSSFAFSQIGIATNNPQYQLHMINSGVVTGGMAVFENNSVNGVSLAAINFSTSNGFNGIEGITYGTYSGVFGLGISDDNQGNFDATGVYGHANDYQGIGVLGVRSGSGGPNNGFAGLFVGTLGYSGGLSNLSDRRTKKNIKSIPNAINLLVRLNPVSYQFDLEKYPYLGLNSNDEFGFIAQEIESVLPSIVQEKMIDVNIGTKKTLEKDYISNKQIFKMVNYIEVIPLLTKGIQEQQQIIDSQNDKIKSLEKKLADLEAKVNSLLEN